jgi:EAL domain-containing protein (putative c-di-GMP-specific phosphodiesterase class I)
LRSIGQRAENERKLMAIPTFREVEDRVGQILRADGGLGVILIDLTPLAHIERTYGGAAYKSLVTQIDPLMLEAKARFRDEDLLARDERDGDRFLIFVSLKARRQPETVFSAGDLKKMAARAEDLVSPRVARLMIPYSRQRHILSVGYGLVVFTPLESAERQILRLIQDAQESAALRASVREREERERLAETVLNYERTLWTVFQPILEVHSRQIMGHEALSRGPRGTDLQSPMALFSMADRHGMVEELERACRRAAFRDWTSFGSPGRLFVNTIPSTVRDSSFLGRGVLDYLGSAISPRQVTLEITERTIIENLSLYREAMHEFLDLGFTFAIDDLGAGYSGLETVASLGASFLKIDMSLVRDLHQKQVNQQIIKAIVEMGIGVGATIIAEGIQTAEEATAIADLGIRYGQGYYYARPIDPRAPQRSAVVPTHR